MHRGCLAIWLAAGAVKTGDFIRFSKQMPCKLLKHQSVTGLREVIVSEVEEVFVPVLARFSRGKEHRKQVDECFASAFAEFAPQGNLPAVAIALRQLLRPGIYHDGQRNI